MERNERRCAYRIDDIIPVLHRRVDRDDPSLRSRVIGLFTSWETPKELPEGAIDPVLAKVLVDIYVKLEIIQKKIEQMGDNLATAEGVPVNISCAGISLRVREKFTEGDMIELKMLLSGASPVGVILYGTITRTLAADNGEFIIAADFCDMDEEVEHELNQYLLYRQREMLSRKRLRRICPEREA